MNNILTHKDLARICQALGADDNSAVELLDKVFELGVLAAKHGDMAVVPVEPTEHMLERGRFAIDVNGGQGSEAELLSDAREAYRAMISAAQENGK